MAAAAITAAAQQQQKHPLTAGEEEVGVAEAEVGAAKRTIT